MGLGSKVETRKQNRKLFGVPERREGSEWPGRVKVRLQRSDFEGT